MMIMIPIFQEKHGQGTCTHLMHVYFISLIDNEYTKFAQEIVRSHSIPGSNEKPYGYELVLGLQRRMNSGKKSSI